MRTKKLINYLFVLVAGLSVFAGVIIASPTSYADGNTLADKSKLYGLAKCYESGGFVSPVSSTGWQGASSLVQSSNQYFTYNGTTDYTTTYCYQIANSYNVIPSGGSDVSTVTSFMNNIGYTSSKVSSSESCIEYKFTNASGERSGANLCTNVDADGKIESNNFTVTYSGPDGNMPTAVKLGTTTQGGHTAIGVDCNIMYWITGASTGGCSPVRYEAGETDFISLGQSIYNQISGAISSNGGISRDKWVFEGDGVIYPDAVEAARNYRRDSRSADGVVRTFSGGAYANVDALKLNDSDKLSLLQSYINGKYSYYTTRDKACGGMMTDTEIANAKADGYQEVALDGNGLQCWIKGQNFTDVPGWNDEDYFDGTMFDFGKVAEELTKLNGGITEHFNQLNVDCKAEADRVLNEAQELVKTDRNQPDTIPAETLKNARDAISKIRGMGGVYYEEKSDGSYGCKDLPDLEGGTTAGASATYTPPVASSTNVSNNSSTPTDSSDFDMDQCFDAAGALGWILCPVLKVVTEATDSIYRDYIQEDFLEVKAEWVSKVEPSWASIRNIANIFFVVFFLVIIFSQLTGIGLSNYSIKKALPRLIVVIVLVNISFFICELAVDLSNILGYTLNMMFNSLIESGSGSSFGSLGDNIMSGLTWVAIAGAAYTTFSFWLGPLLLAAISGAISVIFGALVLGIRQAGVLVLIVLAPVAVACYALPNTKSMFDKWSKAFISLLMVFPICGALVGGGNFAASLILTATDNVMIKVIAMLLRVVPFFLIPSIVKNALNAIGGIGAKISGAGNRMGRGLTGTVRRSDGFHRVQEFSERASGRGIALRHKMLSKITGGRYTGSKGSKRRLAQAISTQESRIRSDAKAGAIASGGFISRSRARDIMSSALDVEETQGIKDAENGYRLDQNFDANNSNTVAQELEERLNELKEDPENIEVRRKVKALTKILLETDDGRGALMETAQQFAEANQGNEATQMLGKFLGNGENMATIKGKNQRGLQNLVKDINNGSQIQSLASYGAAGVDKINANAVGGMDVSSLKSQVAAAGAGTLSGKNLQDLAAKYTQALTSENAANNINGETATELNKIRRLAYMANNGGSDAGFRKLNPGDELKIMRTKAAVPAGWTADGTWVGGGAGPTQQQQIAYQEWAKHSAEVDRHNSQL